MNKKSAWILFQKKEATIQPRISTKYSLWRIELDIYYHEKKENNSPLKTLFVNDVKQWFLTFLRIRSHAMFAHTASFSNFIRISLWHRGQALQETYRWYRRWSLVLSWTMTIYEIVLPTLLQLATCHAAHPCSAPSNVRCTRAFSQPSNNRNSASRRCRGMPHPQFRVCALALRVNFNVGEESVSSNRTMHFDDLYYATILNMYYIPFTRKFFWY